MNKLILNTKWIKKIVFISLFSVVFGINAEDFSINYDNNYNVPFIGSPEIYFKWDVRLSKRLKSNYIAQIEYILIDANGKNIFTQKGSTKASSFKIYCSIKNINSKKEAPVFWIKHFPMNWAESKSGVLPSQFKSNSSVLFSGQKLMDGNFSKKVELFQSRLPQANDKIKKCISAKQLRKGETSTFKLIDKNTVQILYSTYGKPVCNFKVKLFIKITTEKNK